MLVELEERVRKDKNKSQKRNLASGSRILVPMKVLVRCERYLHALSPNGKAINKWGNEHLLRANYVLGIILKCNFLM